MNACKAKLFDQKDTPDFDLHCIILRQFPGILTFDIGSRTQHLLCAKAFAKTATRLANAARSELHQLMLQSSQYDPPFVLSLLDLANRLISSATLHTSTLEPLPEDYAVIDISTAQFFYDQTHRYFEEHYKTICGIYIMDTSSPQPSSLPY